MKKRQKSSFRAPQAALVAGCALLSLIPAGAQTAQPSSKPVASQVKISALKVYGEWGGRQGLRLEGTAAAPAYVKHPQLGVTAPKIDVGFNDDQQFTKVTASNGVSFAVTLPQKDGPATRIEAKCNNATLERSTSGANVGARVLVLRGGVDGWYQVSGGLRNTLRGETVTLTSRPGTADSLVANIEGGADGVRIEVPPATPARSATDVKPDIKPAPNVKPDIKPAANRGLVIITAQNAVVRQQKDGVSADVDGGTRGVRMEMQAAGSSSGAVGDLLSGAVVVTSRRAIVRQTEGLARFIGDAHALSKGASQNFDVTADEIIMSRNADGEFEVVKTSGRAKVKLDLTPAKVAVAKTGEAKAGEAKAGAVAPGADSKTSMRPEYLEVEADSAEALLVKNQLVFAGNVRGFYRLSGQAQAQTQVPAQANQEANRPAALPDYKFSGHNVIITYNPKATDPSQSWNFNFTGQLGVPGQIDVPVEIDAPALGLEDF